MVVALAVGMAVVVDGDMGGGSLGRGCAGGVSCNGGVGGEGGHEGGRKGGGRGVLIFD